MSDLSFEMAGIAPDGMVIQPDKRFVRFQMGKKLHAQKTQEAGRSIFVPQIQFCVRQVGERDETVVEATEFHKMMHPRQWAAFEEKREAEIIGTPIDLLFPSSPEVVENMKALRVYTVEMLAAISEEGLRRLGMGAREWKAKAEQFMDRATQSAPLRELEAKLESRDAKIRLLEDQMALLIEAAQKPKRRRGAEDNTEPEGDGA